MGVFPPVHEYVNDRVADGARRGGGPGVESVGPHGPAASKGTVHGAGDADREPCDAARQARSVFGLDQEVKMVVLGGELDDPEPLVEAAASARRTAGKTRSARRQRTAAVARNVTWIGCAVLCGGRARWGTLGRPPGVGLRPAPRRRPPQVRG